MSVFVRALTTLKEENGKKNYFFNQDEINYNNILVFDTETTIDEFQNLKVGYFRVYVKGELNIDAPASNVESISGSAWGDISFQKELRFIYPNSFDATNCETADGSDNIVGFGADGYLNVKLGGAFNVALDRDGFRGEVVASASGVSFLKVKWPCTISCSPDCLNESNVSISGQLKLSYDNKTVLSGDLNFKGQDGEAEDKHVELEF